MRDEYSVDDHFRTCGQQVHTTYCAILQAANRLGCVREDPKKTGIHLIRNTAFAGVATRKSSIVLTLKSAVDIASSRIMRSERVSANRWHVEIKLESPDEVDQELISWLKAAFELAG